MYKTITICFLAALLVVGAAMSASAQAELRAHYKFSEGTGTTVADSSGFLNTATTDGGQWSTDFATGKYGTDPGSYNFDGVTGNNSVTAPHDDSLNMGAGTFSLSMLLKTTSGPSGGDAVFVCKGTVLPTQGPLGTGLGSRYRFYQKGSTIRLEIDDGRTGHDTKIQGEWDPAPILTGEWVHVVVTCDRGSNTMAMYVDGALQTVTMTSPFAVLCENIDDPEGLIMGNYWLLDNPLTSLVDDVRIYSGVLTDSDIAAIFLEPTPPPFTGAGAQHWEMFY